jgi:hypothetical protein
VGAGMEDDDARGEDCAWWDLDPEDLEARDTLKMIIGSIEKMKIPIADLGLNLAGFNGKQSSCRIIAFYVNLQSYPTRET